MRLIAAVDEKGGMMFHGRRQSKDSVLRNYLLELARTEGTVLWMNADSARQFQGEGEGLICVDEDFLSKAGERDYCFLEDMRLLEDYGNVCQAVIVRWNRRYPADVFFDPAVLEGKRLTGTEEFAGSSHEKITVEVYEEKPV